MKKYLLFYFTLAAASTSFGQLGGGARLGYDMYFGGKGLKTISIGGFGSYTTWDQILMRFGLQFSAPMKFNDSYYAYARNSTTTPQRIEVEGETKVAVMNLYYDGAYYFLDGDSDYGGLYGLLGIGFNIAADKTTFASFPNDYNLSDHSRFGEERIYFQTLFRLFLGYDYGFDRVNTFFEGGLLIPTSQVKNERGSITMLPACVELSAGIRF